LATTLETNTAANLTFEITETTGSASYTMTFSTTQTGTVVYNDITYQTGEEIPVMAGKFNGHYIGELMGSHTVEFTVTNNNTTPVPKTDSVSFTFEDKDTVPPVISITGPDMITHLAGTPYTAQGATATDNIDSDVTVQLEL